MSEVELALSFPLDADGFLRRSCPSCGREFKWQADESVGDSESAPSTYFCPYCRASAPPDDWFTEEQVAYIHDELMERVVAPSLDELARTVQDLERTSGGLIRGGLDIPRREDAPPIFEPNDMRLVEFACHPDEPLKVADDWKGDVHCLICGEPTDASIR